MMGGEEQSCRPQLSGFACTTSPAHEIEYNIVYQQLVENDNDVVGQLAYCLYKQSKQKHLREFL